MTRKPVFAIIVWFDYEGCEEPEGEVVYAEREIAEAELCELLDGNLKRDQYGMHYHIIELAVVA